ncbi:MAG TPA: hypothetical protein VG735_06085 [Caulobacterales bacterium]|nr:hypothetical protein [Caulobacterales bacterium]
MTFKTATLATVIFLCAATVASAERSGSEPETNSKRDVLDWAARELDLTGWYYVTHAIDHSLFMSRPYHETTPSLFMVKLRAERFRVADTGEMSLISDAEVDCSAHRTRLLGTIAFAKRNLRKPVVFTRKADGWRNPENTIMDDVYQAICLAPPNL